MEKGNKNGSLLQKIKLYIFYIYLISVLTSFAIMFVFDVVEKHRMVRGNQITCVGNNGMLISKAFDDIRVTSSNILKNQEVQELISQSSNVNEVELNNYLTSIKGFDNLHIFDANNNLKYSHLQIDDDSIDLIVKEIDNEIGFRVDNNKNSKVFYSFSNVYNDDDNALLGKVIVEYDVDDVLNLLTSKYFYKTRELILITESNDVVYSSNWNLLNTNIDSDLIRYMKGNTPGDTTKEDYKGDKSVAYFQKLSDTYEDIYIYTKVDQKEIVMNVVQKYAILFIVVLIIPTLFLLLINKRLKKVVRNPLRELREVVRKVAINSAASQYKYEVELKYDTEINMLANEINNMTKILFSFYKETNQKLAESNHLAKTSSNAKSIFLANMSHEMRTPLNAIIGYVQLIDKLGRDDHEIVSEYLERIKVSSEILLQKINDVLDISKIESGYIELVQETVDIREVVEDVFDVLSVSASEKDINFYHTIDDKIIQNIKGDYTRLEQILINICSNAIKFTDEGFIHLDAKMKSMSEEELVIEWSVEDTGKGIDQNMVENIFKPFIQEDNLVSNKYGGTGLGLTITKELIELMGGEITVESTLNEGSKFRFITCHEIEGNEFKSKLAAKQFSHSDVVQVLKNKKILVVEDNLINQTLIMEIFKYFEYENVEIIENGQLALENCKTTYYDLILMDIQMPVMNGVEATKEIRKLINYKTIPIIALTANVFSDQIANYVDAGMTDYIPKPIQLTRVEEVLMKFL